ncbi:MAG: sensor histidine kinase [Candidatus Muiribacteriota bacterium]
MLSVNYYSLSKIELNSSIIKYIDLESDYKKLINACDNNIVFIKGDELKSKIKTVFEISQLDAGIQFIVFYNSIGEVKNLANIKTDLNLNFAFSYEYQNDILFEIINMYLEKNIEHFFSSDTCVRIETENDRLIFQKRRDNKCKIFSDKYYFRKNSQQSIGELKYKGLNKSFYFNKEGKICRGIINLLESSIVFEKIYFFNIKPIMDIDDISERILYLSDKNPVFFKIYNLINHLIYTNLNKNDYIKNVLKILTDFFKAKHSLYIFHNSYIVYNNNKFQKTDSYFESIDNYKMKGIYEEHDFDEKNYVLNFNFEWLNLYLGNMIFEVDKLEEEYVIFARILEKQISASLNFFAMNEKNKMEEKKVFQQEKMASLGQLYLGVTHEINNPNTIVYGNTELIDFTCDDLKKLVEQGKIEKEKLCEMFKNILESNKAISNASERITEIIQNLKLFSKFDFTQIKKINIDKVILKVEEDINSKIIPTCKFNINKSTNKPALIMANFDEIYQVFFNLIMNAAQSINEKQNVNISDSGFIGLIYIEIITGLNVVKVKIRDTGFGIDKLYLSKIFDPFFSTRGTKGMGLGLNIVYSIVTKYGGEIKVDSEKNKFFEIEIEFPLA